MTISSKLTPKRAKKAAANIILLVDKLKMFSDMKNEATGKEGAELNEAGYGILRRFINFALNDEYELIISIIADLFGISPEESEDLSIEEIYDSIAKDRVLLNFFPQLLKSEQGEQ